MNFENLFNVFRMDVEYPTEAGQAILKIEDVHVDDEAVYKCEITYIEVKESCHEVVQIVNLTTLGKFVTKVKSLGKESPHILDKCALPERRNVPQQLIEIHSLIKYSSKPQLN